MKCVQMSKCWWIRVRTDSALVVFRNSGAVMAGMGTFNWTAGR